MAVQGKLVEQVSNEGDGKELLEKILLKTKSKSEIDQELAQSYASIPSGWAIGTLGDVSEIIRGVSFPGSAKSPIRQAEDVACLRTASVQEEIDWDDMIYIAPDYVARDDQWIKVDDVVISMANSYALVGKVAIVRQVQQRATFGAFLAVLRPVLIEPFFLLYVLRSPRMQAAFRESSSQTTNIANISLGRMRPLPFPLPPLAEQKRIVAKVDELMALCDRLEAQQQQRAEKHSVLARAAVSRFADAPTPANLDFIFHNAYPITPADLRKTILTLAVQGRLVPQDPNDELVPSMLAQIETLRESMIAKKQFRRSKLPDVLTEIPFEIPQAWKWVYLGRAMLNITDGFHSTPQTVETGVRYITAKHVKPELIDFDSCLFVSENDFKEIANKTRAKKGDVLIVNIGAGSGIASIIDVDFEFAFKNVAILNRPEQVDSKYLFHYLSFKREGIFEDQTKGGAQPFLSLSILREVPFPLPPLAEQKRIVAKVDELMKLVDQLETQLTASSQQAEQLMNAIVAELTAA